MVSLRAYLDREAEITDDPAGDFLQDWRDDRERPSGRLTANRVRCHVHSLEALEAFEEVLERYRQEHG